MEQDLSIRINDFLMKTIESSGVKISHTVLQNSIYNLGNRAAIANVFRKALRGEEITLCAFGGSITEGIGYQDVPTEESGIKCSLPKMNYFDHVCSFWEAVFHWKITKINAGIGATDTVLAVHRMNDDVLRYNPDLVIVEWCCNDGKEVLYKQATYESMVRRILEEGTALIMLSMATQNGTSSQMLHEPISDWYDVPMISYRDTYYGLTEYPYLTNDGVHPNCVGHALTGLIINHFMAETFNQLEILDDRVPECRKDILFEESAYYQGAGMITLKEIYEEKIAGAKIIDLGSFTIDEETKSFGFRKYYSFTARYAEKYDPLVIELDMCKTLFLLIYRNTVFSGTDFWVELNGKKIENHTFTCKHGGDNEQIEWDYHWATERLCYNPKPEKVVLKIHPDVTNKDAFMRIFALLVS